MKKVTILIFCLAILIVPLQPVNADDDSFSTKEETRDKTKGILSRITENLRDLRYKKARIIKNLRDKREIDKLIRLEIICFSSQGQDPSDHEADEKYFRKMHELAEKGSESAQFVTGLNYYCGANGVTKNHTEALGWFLKSAEQGSYVAQNIVGVMYSNGEGTQQDYKEAETWYRKSAEKGYAMAQLNLGFVYYRGKGIPKDYVMAHKWFILSAAQGDEKAREYIDHMTKKMTHAQIEEAQKSAEEWNAEDRWKLHH